MVGKKLAVLLSETGVKPDALLISTERYASARRTTWRTAS